MNQVQYGNVDRNMNRAPKPAMRAAQRRYADEDRAWSALYRSIKEPAAAAEVVDHLESDEQILRQHTALYLRSRETLRRERARVARNQRIGQLVRGWFVALVSLCAGARRVARNGGDMALEVLVPERVEPVGPKRVAANRVEPAVKRARKLAQQREFSPMPEGFVGPAVPAGVQVDKSTGTKAAGNVANGRGA